MTEAPLGQLSGLRSLLERHSERDRSFSSQIPREGLDFGLKRQKEKEIEILSDAIRKKAPIQRQIEDLQAELNRIDREAQREIDWTRRTK